jgi:tetratricopeptide (TPR) repeat protein
MMHRLGLTFEGTGKWAEAEEVHREALALWRKRSGNEDVQTLYAMRNLAATLDGAGKWPEAETMHRDVLALWRKRAGSGDEDILYTLDSLRSTLEAERKWAEAETIVREALTLRRQRTGDTSPGTLNTMRQLGLTLEGEGKWSEAESVQRDVLALWRKKAGNDDPDSLYAIRNLAAMFEREGKLSEAEQLTREEFESWRKKAGDEDRQTFYTRRKLGSLLEAQGKWSEAESVFRESLRLARNRGKEDPEALADLERLVRVLMPQKKFGEAEQLLGEVLTPAFVTQPASVSLLVQRVNLMGRRGRWQKAAVDAAQVLEFQPREHYRYHTLAGLLAMIRNRAGYEQVCKRLLTIFTNTTDYFVAERMAQDCLLLPDSRVDLALVDKLADFTVTAGSSDPALPYFQVCKAMSNYRLGRFHEAVEWAETAAKNPKAEAQAKAKAFAVLAMANWQLGQQDLSREALAKGNELAPDISPESGTADLGESWMAWLMARISLDEATKVIRTGSAINQGSAQR